MQPGEFRFSHAYIDGKNDPTWEGTWATAGTMGVVAFYNNSRVPSDKELQAVKEGTLYWGERIGAMGLTMAFGWLSTTLQEFAKSRRPRRGGLPVHG